MKRLFFLLPVILPGVFLLYGLYGFRAEKSATLRLHLENGSSYLYTNAFSQDLSMLMAGQPMHMALDMHSTMHVQVTGKYGGDSMQMKAAYSHIAFNLSSTARHSSFDSDDPSGRFNNLFTALRAHPVTVTTDSQGKIAGLEGLPQLRTAVKAELPPNDGIQKLFDNLLDDNTFSANFTNLGLFPSQPVSVGDHWDRDVSMDNMIATTAHTTYTVKDITPEKVVLGVDGRIVNAEDSADINGMVVPVQVAGTQAGTYTVERSTGLITGSLDQKMEVTLSLMGQNMVMDLKGKIKVNETPAPIR